MSLVVDIRGVRHMVMPDSEPEEPLYNVVLRCGGYTHAPDADPGISNCLFCWGSLRVWALYDR